MIKYLYIIPEITIQKKDYKYKKVLCKLCKWGISHYLSKSIYIISILTRTSPPMLLSTASFWLIKPEAYFFDNVGADIK